MKVPLVSSRAGLAYLAAVALITTTYPAVAQGPGQLEWAERGRWEGPFDWASQFAPGCFEENEIAHAVLIAAGPYQGRVLLWNYRGVAVSPTPPGCEGQLSHTTRSWIFDPSFPTQLLRIDKDLDSNIFCSGHCARPDGTIVVVGGVLSAVSGATPVECYVFDPHVLGLASGGVIPVPPDPWSASFDMAHERYYPTLIPLNRRINSTVGTVWSSPGSSSLVIGGGVVSGSHPPPFVSWLEVLPPSGLVWKEPLVPDNELNPPASSHPYERHTTSGLAPEPPGPTDAPWLTKIESYSRAFQLSNGHVLLANDVDTLAMSSASLPGASWILRPPSSGVLEWQLYEGPYENEPAGVVVDRFYGTAVLLHQRAPLEHRDRVLVFGGSQSAGATVHKSVSEFSPITATPFGIWNVLKADTQKRRIFLNGVVLPTRQVLLVGGGEADSLQGGLDVPCFAPELYEPGDVPSSSGSSTLMEASNSVPGHAAPHDKTPRLYHHIALLLPDGRVFVAGGNSANNSSAYPDSEFTGEIFSPPYLFQGTRPTIRSGASSTVLWATPEVPQSFTAGVNTTTGPIERVVLIRPGSVTHHFDSDQRYLELLFTPDPATPVAQGLVGTVFTLTITPPDDLLAPPGWYMMFVVERASNGKLLPSTAHFIEVKAQ